MKILPETRIYKMPYKCKNSKCRKDFSVHVWDAQYNHWIKGKPDKSGCYLVRYNGTICRDEYTTSGGGIGGILVKMEEMMILLSMILKALWSLEVKIWRCGAI